MMTRPFHPQVARPALLITIIFIVGTLGYRVLEGASWWRAFYMTVITLTTVGFGEVFPLSPIGQIFTAVLLLTGLGVFLFTLTEIGRTVLQGELQEYWGRARRMRMIERMSGHEIVCGYDRTGRAVVEELRRSGRAVVVIEQNRDRVQPLHAAEIPCIVDDATTDEALRAAGIERAHGLAACLKDDAQNVYAVLTARGLNRDLVIVARATEEVARQRMIQAGADRVINPFRLGGRRLAHLLTRPAVVGLFDASLGPNSPDLQLEQVVLDAASPMTNCSLDDLDLRRKTGLNIVAVKRGEMFLSNPEPEFRLQTGDVAIVLGTTTQITAFEEAFVNSKPDTPVRS